MVMLAPALITGSAFTITAVNGVVSVPLEHAPVADHEKTQ